MQPPQENLSETPSLTHLDSRGAARMVDISAKAITERTAIAVGKIRMNAATLEAIEAGNAPKGDVVGTARIAGIMAAKQTSQLIPLCHPLSLTKVSVEIEADKSLPGYNIRATVATKGQTGVEMEALTAVSIAALTLYDMAKALDRHMEIADILLLEKTK
jgi:cyclic pyranopterin monophosphate synthase